MVAPVGFPHGAIVSDEELNKLSETQLSRLDVDTLAGLFHRGYTRAIDALLVKCSRDVFQAALGFVSRSDRPNDLAADIAQETILRVLNKIALFDPQRGSFKTWIISICRNETIDVIRKAQRRGEIAGDVIQKDGHSIFELIMASDASQEYTAIVDSYKKDVWDCVRALPPHYRSVCTAYLDGIPFSAMPATLSTPETMARNRFNRAKRKLRDCLQTKGITTVIDLGSEQSEDGESACSQ